MSFDEWLANLNFCKSFRGYDVFLYTSLRSLERFSLHETYFLVQFLIPKSYTALM